MSNKNKNAMIWVLGILLVLILVVFALVFVWNNFFKPLSQDGFHISQYINNEWKQLYVSPFKVKYETKSFSLTPQNGQVKIRIDEKVTPYADIEFANLTACGQNLTPQYASYVSNNNSVLSDIMKDDNNVSVIHDSPIEISWQIPKNCNNDVTFKLKANQYYASEANAHRFPENGVKETHYTFQNNGSIQTGVNLKGIDKVVAPTYNIFWESGTGHPSNYAYIYMKDDSNFVYIGLDVTGDNTNEQGPSSGWYKIYTLNSKTGKKQEYFINSNHKQYGECDFGLTSKVSYKHATCVAKIPKAELSGNYLNFYASYYGTSAEPSYEFSNVGATSSSSLKPTIVGHLNVIGSAGNITSVKYSLKDLSTGDYLTNQWDGICSSDDFGTRNVDFTCETDSTFAYGKNYQYQFYAEGDTETTATKTFGYTPYPYKYSILSDFSDNNWGACPPAFNSLLGSGDTLYGATQCGGPDWLGTVVSIKTSGDNPTRIHSFGSSPTDGTNPLGSLVKTGNKLYGTTTYGGDNGDGTIYSVDIDGNNYSVLYSFSGGVSDGSYPYASLVEYGGLLYGTTQTGGADDSGVIYSINPNGSGFNLLHTFLNDNHDGLQAVAGPMVADSTNNVLYGMTTNGGENSFGTVYSIHSNGSGYRTLYSFDYPVSGGSPVGGLILINNKLYGMNQIGGTSGTGVIFSINTDGSGISLLHEFSGGVNDGSGPLGSLTLYKNKLYGGTSSGGDNNQGTLFSISIDGTGFSLIHSFTNLVFDGQAYAGAPYIANDVIYGMTPTGGTNGYSGAMFSLILPFPSDTPQSNPIPSIGPTSPNTGLEPVSYIPAVISLITGIGLLVVARQRYS